MAYPEGTMNVCTHRKPVRTNEPKLVGARGEVGDSPKSEYMVPMHPMGTTNAYIELHGCFIIAFKMCEHG